MRTPVNFATHRWSDRLAQLLWPSRCALCAAPGHGGIDLCAPCTEVLPWNVHPCMRCALPLPQSAPACGQCLRYPPPVCITQAAFTYTYPMDRLLPRLKFHDGLAAAPLLAQLSAPVFGNCERPQALIPVPLHRTRLRQRGYDQTLELVKPLSRLLDLPLRADLLQRVRAAPPQSRLSATQRERNVRDAFAVNTSKALPNHVALFDDVMTTGATLYAAAQALLEAGVQRVDAWVCARVA